MPKRRALLAMTKPGISVELTAEDWVAITRVSGIQPPQEALVRLRLAVKALAFRNEGSSPSISTLKHIEKLKASVQEFKRHFPPFDPDIFAGSNPLAKYVDHLEIIEPQILLQGLARLADEIEDTATKILTRPPSGYLTVSEGDAWDSWINVVTLILRDAGLPRDVRKDDGTSPFVIFIRELQAKFPAHLYKKRSDSALATAILRARMKLFHDLERDVGVGLGTDLLLLVFMGIARFNLKKGFDVDVDPEGVEILKTLGRAIEGLIEVRH